LSTLSPAQNKVLTELAFLWDAASVEDLIPKCNMDGKTISALLNQLTQSRHVEKIKGNTKNLLYRLEERFFNLWFNMTQGGPQQKIEVKALTDYLEEWYNMADLKNLYMDFKDSIKSEKIKKEYKESTNNAHFKNNMFAEEDGKLLYGKLKDKNTKIYFDEAIQSAVNEEDYLKVIDKLEISKVEETLKNFLLGLCFEKLNNFKDSEKYYLLASEKNNIDALMNIASIYFDKRNKTKLKNLISKQSQDSLKLFAKMNFELLALIYLYLGEMEKYQEMIAHYNQSNHNSASSSFIFELLRLKQINWVYKYFTINEKAKELFKPLYYSTLVLKGGHDHELLKMPPEINENVQDIIMNVKDQKE
jgi:hypothetical protein